MHSNIAKLITITAAAFAINIGTAYADDAMPVVANPAGNPFMVQMKALIPQLDLTPDQNSLYQSALDTMRLTHASERLNGDQLNERDLTIQQQPVLDLHALHAAHEQAAAQDAKLREQSAVAWLAFYDSLNTTQKTSVSALLKQQFALIERHPATPYDPRTGL